MQFKITDTNFKAEVLECEIPVLVDFWAPWCGPCQMVAPVIEDIAREYKDKIKVCKINVDEASVTAASYRVMSIPTLAVFKSGKVVDKVIGVQPKSKLVEMCKPYIEQ